MPAACSEWNTHTQHITYDIAATSAWWGLSTAQRQCQWPPLSGNVICPRRGSFPFRSLFLRYFSFLINSYSTELPKESFATTFPHCTFFCSKLFSLPLFCMKEKHEFELIWKRRIYNKKKNGKSLGQVKAYVVASSQLGIVLVCVGCIGLGYDPLHILFFFLSTEPHRWLRKIGWVHCPERSILVSCIVALWWTVGQMAHSMLSKPSVPDTFGLLPSVDMYAFNLRPVRVPTIHWQCQSIKIMVTECLHWTLVRGNITQRQTNKERKSCGVNHIEMAANVTVGDVLSAFYSMMAHIGW